MTDKEMKARLATLTHYDIAKIERMIGEGFGAHGIALETRYTLKQVNAVFHRASMRDWSDDRLSRA